MGLADLIIGLLLGGDDEPAPRPQGPGLNIGEANVRRAVGLPTRARRVAYETSSGPGMGPEAIARIRERERPQNRYQGRKPLPKKFVDKDFGPDKVKYGMAGLRKGMGLPTTARQADEWNKLMPLTDEIMGGVDKSSWMEPSYVQDARDARESRQNAMSNIGDGLSWFRNNAGRGIDLVTGMERGWSADPEERKKLVREGKAKKGNGGINWNPFDGKL